MERSGIVWLAERLRNLAGIEPTAPLLQVSDQARSDPGPDIDRIYARNLATLLELTKAIGAIPVFAPQQLNASVFENGARARPWTPNVVDAAVPALMSHLNQILETACTAPCVFATDVASEHFATQDFVDEGHFGRSGATKLAHALSRTLGRAPLGTPRAQSA